MHKRLTEQEYIDEQRHLFCRLHQHDGVWWDEVFPGYSRPAFQFRAMVPGSARPSRSRSLLGYRHHVPELAFGNQAVDYMILEGDDLRQFALDRLGSNTRNHVRKGLKRCEVRELLELEPYLEDARDVCISHSKRLEYDRRSYHVPHTYFIRQAEAWRAEMRRDFLSRGHTWWGAFSEGRLVGYIVMLQVDDTAILYKMKVHTDGLSQHVSDALYFTALEQVGRNETCRRIFNSTPHREGLDRFKMHFLFKPTPVPFYVSNLPLYKCAVRILAIRERLVLHLRDARRHRLGPELGSGGVRSPAGSEPAGAEAASSLSSDHQPTMPSIDRAVRKQQGT